MFIVFIGLVFHTVQEEVMVVYLVVSNGYFWMEFYDFFSFEEFIDVSVHHVFFFCFAVEGRDFCVFHVFLPLFIYFKKRVRLGRVGSAFGGREWGGLIQ